MIYYCPHCNRVLFDNPSKLELFIRNDMKLVKENGKPLPCTVKCAKELTEREIFNFINYYRKTELNKMERICDNCSLAISKCRILDPSTSDCKYSLNYISLANHIRSVLLRSYTVIADFYDKYIYLENMESLKSEKKLREVIKKNWKKHSKLYILPEI